ncbi:hypothetical protein [Micromonospora sp. SH-82]|uniref:hypothetical protein n=1 Tax=Micromonospora sp. SH-82 TaxID=3132938 RepID=UPI003EBAD0D2
MSLTEAEAEEAVRVLLEVGLLRPGDPGGGRLVPISPDLARSCVLSPLQREIDLAQDRVRLLGGELASLTGAYERSLDEGRSDRSQVVPDRLHVRQLITGLAAETTDEVLASQPGGGRAEEVLTESLDRTDRLLRRGVRMLTLYQHTARFSPATSAFASHVSALGGEVRTSADGFARCLIFDRRVAVIGLSDSDDGAAVVRDPNTVAFMVDGFQRCWNGASPMSITNYRRDTSTAVRGVRRAIASLLITGEPDVRIAQRVGLSLRTCQRHIADLMGGLGARNRLQLGYILASADLDEPGAGDPLRPAPSAG